MSFKYQTPANYASTSLVIAGNKLDVKNGVIESEQDIYHILKPLGFERAVEASSTKKASTTST